MTPNANRDRGGAVVDAALWRLRAMWRALYGTECPPESEALLTSMFAGWGSGKVGERAPWPSDIGDDHSPFELSVVFSGGKHDLRLLIEAQNGSEWAAVRDTTLTIGEPLAARGADLSRLHKLRDLVFPDPREVRDPRLLVWFCASMLPGPIRSKVYLYPKVLGRDRAPALIRSTLETLGLPAAWPTIETLIREQRLDDYPIFCMDLDGGPTARVKVYLQASGTTADVFENVARLGPHYVPGEVTDFCRRVTDSTGPYAPRDDVRVPMTYLAFTANEPRPSDVTLQIPIRSYVRDDAVAARRVRDYLRSRDIDPAPFDRTLEAIATRPLTEGRGLVAWITLRTGLKPAYVTVYFGAEMYHRLPVYAHLPG